MLKDKIDIWKTNYFQARKKFRKDQEKRKHTKELKSKIIVENDAVELEKEKMVVLGQCVSDTNIEDLNVGMEMELALDVLYEDDDNEYLIWKWKPIGA